MAISVRQTSRDRSGRIVKGGLQRVGFQKREGGGYERVAGGTITTERGSLNIERQVEERQAAQREYEAATATREEAVASTVDQFGRPSVIKQTYGPASSRNQGELIIGSGSWAVPIAGASPIQRKQSQTVSGSIQARSSTVEGRFEEFSSRQGMIAEQSRGRDTFRSLGASTLAFGSGVAISGIRTTKFAKEAVTNPLQTTRNIGIGAFNFARNPVQRTRESVFNVGESLRTNPARFAGVVAGDLATGFGIERGARAGVRAARFAGKPQVAAADVVAPSYLAGTEVYPTGTPRQSVVLANRERRVFSASPEAPNKGRSYNVFTQQEKIAAGLPLSETGGLYGASRVSPIFTQVVTKEPSSYRLSIIPRWGAPGAVSEIGIKGAERLPASVRRQQRREGSIRAGNVFLDEGGVVRAGGGGKAFSTPATELGIKNEAELLIAGGSQIERTPSRNFGWFSRVTGRDFDYYVNIPKTPGSTETVPVAFRQYRNIGFSDEVVARARGRTVSGASARRVTRASDIEYYSAPRASSAGIFAYPSVLSSLSSGRSRATSIGSYFGSGASGSRASSFTSGGLFRTSSSTFSSSTRSTSYSSGGYSSRSLSSLFSGGTSRSSYSFGFRGESFTPLPPGFRPPFNPPLDEGKRRKKGKRFEQTKQRSIFASSLTAGVLGLRGGNRGRQAGGFTGLELRGL